MSVINTMTTLIDCISCHQSPPRLFIVLSIANETYAATALPALAQCGAIFAPFGSAVRNITLAGCRAGHSWDLVVICSRHHCSARNESRNTKDLSDLKVHDARTVDQGKYNFLGKRI